MEWLAIALLLSCTHIGMKPSIVTAGNRALREDMEATLAKAALGGDWESDVRAAFEEALSSVLKSREEAKASSSLPSTLPSTPQRAQLFGWAKHDDDQCTLTLEDGTCFSRCDNAGEVVGDPSLFCFHQDDDPSASVNPWSCDGLPCLADCCPTTCADFARATGRTCLGGQYGVHVVPRAEYMRAGNLMGSLVDRVDNASAEALDSRTTTGTKIGSWTSSELKHLKYLEPETPFRSEKTMQVLAQLLGGDSEANAERLRQGQLGDVYYVISEVRNVAGNDSLTDDEIVRALGIGYTPPDIATLVQDPAVRSHELAVVEQSNNSLALRSRELAVDKCGAGIRNLIISAISLFMSALGLGGMGGAVGKAVARVIGKAANVRLAKLVGGPYGISNDGFVKILSKIVKAILTAPNFSLNAMIKIIDDQMSWWEWILLGLKIILTIGSFILTGGLAFFATVVSAGVGIYDGKAAIEQIVSHC